MTRQAIAVLQTNQNHQSSEPLFNNDADLSPAQQEQALRFLHVIEQKQPLPKDKSIVDPRKYKTRMCRNYELYGVCVYEKTCCFAHGPTELRDVLENHKQLASIGYFSNVVLLAMTNTVRPALPMHSLYQQPAVLEVPDTREKLESCTAALPAGVEFPFQKPLPTVLEALRQDPEPKPEPKSASRRRRHRRYRSHRKLKSGASETANTSLGNRSASSAESDEASD